MKTECLQTKWDAASFGVGKEKSWHQLKIVKLKQAREVAHLSKVGPSGLESLTSNSVKAILVISYERV